MPQSNLARKAVAEPRPLASVREYARYLNHFEWEDLFGEPPLIRYWYEIFAIGTPNGTAKDFLVMPFADHAKKLAVLRSNRCKLEAQFDKGKPSNISGNSGVWRSLKNRTATAIRHHEQFVVFSHNFLRLEANQRAAIREVFL